MPYRSTTVLAWTDDICPALTRILSFGEDFAIHYSAD
jgi:hypothetical protein